MFSLTLRAVDCGFPCLSSALLADYTRRVIRIKSKSSSPHGSMRSLVLNCHLDKHCSTRLQHRLQHLWDDVEDVL